MKNIIQRSLRSVATFSVLCLASSQLAAQLTPQGGGTRSSDPLPTIPAKCPNQGVRTVPASIVEGPAICDTALSLTITLPGGGGTVTVGGTGCPSYVEIIPSYDKAVIKPGYFISGSQKVYHQRATYDCVACGLLWLFTCCEAQTKFSDTSNYKTSYEEFPCAVIIR